MILLLAPRVAVLDLHDNASLEPEEHRWLSDLVRGAAVGQDEVHLLTRENILEMLPPGTSLADCEAECEVETGRRVGAKYIVTGELLRFAGGLRAVLRLHETEGGALLGEERVAVDDLAALEPALRAAAQALYANLPGGQPSAPPQAAPGTSEAPGLVGVELDPEAEGALRGAISFDLTPPTASVRFNGVSVAKRGLPARAGVHRITVRATGHAPFHGVLVATRRGGVARIALKKLAGRISVRTSLPGARIFIDDTAVGQSPRGGPFRVAEGTHEVRLEHPCAVPVLHEVEVEADGHSQLEVPLESVCGTLDLSVVPGDAQLTLDGRRLSTGRQEVVSGVYWISARARGHEALRRRIHIRKGKESKLRLKLKSLEGELRVSAQNFDGSACRAPLRIDGVPKGQTPWRGQLRIGQHQLAVDCDHTTARAQVSLGTNAKLQVKLAERSHRRSISFTNERLRDYVLEWRRDFGRRRQWVPRLGFGVNIGWHNFSRAPRDDHRMGASFGTHLSLSLPLSPRLDLVGGARAAGVVAACAKQVDPERCEGLDPDRPEAFTRFGGYGALSIRGTYGYAQAGWTYVHQRATPGFALGPSHGPVLGVGITY